MIKQLVTALYLTNFAKMINNFIYVYPIYEACI